MAIRSDEALDRWMYKRDGMDYGPFTTREIEHMIERKEIHPETEVLNRRTRQWARVKDQPKLRAYIEEQSRKAAEAAREAEIAADHQAVHRGNWWTHRIPLVGGALLLACGGVMAFVLLRPPPPVLAGYPANFYRDLRFERLVPLRAMIVEPAKVEPEPAKVVHTKARSSGSGGGAGAVDLAPQVDLSFGGEDLSGGRELTHGDLDGVQRLVAPRLVRCFRSEASRNADFEGGSVFVYVMPRGVVQVSRIETQPSPSPELTSCARAAAAGVKVPAFAGAAQVMEIPLHVAGSR